MYPKQLSSQALRKKRVRKRKRKEKGETTENMERKRERGEGGGKRGKEPFVFEIIPSILVELQRRLALRGVFSVGLKLSSRNKSVESSSQNPLGRHLRELRLLREKDSTTSKTLAGPGIASTVSGKDDLQDIGGESRGCAEFLDVGANLPRGKGGKEESVNTKGTEISINDVRCRQRSSWGKCGEKIEGRQKKKKKKC